MSKFNQSKASENLTLNNEVNLAYKLADKEKLMSMVLTSFYGEDKFYGDNTSEMLKLASELIAGNCGKCLDKLIVLS